DRTVTRDVLRALHLWAEHQAHDRSEHCLDEREAGQRALRCQGIRYEYVQVRTILAVPGVLHIGFTEVLRTVDVGLPAVTRRCSPVTARNDVTDDSPPNGRAARAR